MIVLIETRWFRSQPDPACYDHSEGLELHVGWPKPYGYWFVDRHSLRPRNWGHHYAIPAANIIRFATVQHKSAACTLLLFSKSLLHTSERRPNPKAAYDERQPQYLELGTTFSETVAQQIRCGLSRLDHQVIEFTWPELLAEIHR